VALDRLLRNGNRLEPERLGGLQKRALVQPALGRVRERVRGEDRLERRFARGPDHDRARAKVVLQSPEPGSRLLDRDSLGCSDELGRSGRIEPTGRLIRVLSNAALGVAQLDPAAEDDLEILADDDDRRPAGVGATADRRDPLRYPTSSLNAASSRMGSKSESPIAISRQPSHRSIAWRRCPIASPGRPARLSQHATL